MAWHSTFEDIPASALGGSMRDFRTPIGSNLLERTGPFNDWQKQRRVAGMWPFSRATETGPAASCAVRDDEGNLWEGVNFASQDYLSLASHPEVAEAAQRAIIEVGVHSAGSGALVGNTATSVALERQIASFLHTRAAILYATGWSAGFGVITGLVRPHDYVVMDGLAHSCLQTGASAATRNVALFRHLDIEHCRRRLASIRARDTSGGILVVTESLFSMNSDTPDIAAMQDLASEYGASLLVDVAHDLGALGPGGTGHLGAQNMLGKVDLVMGSFSKTFGTNGGFVATGRREVSEYLKYYSPTWTFSNAPSPVQVAVAGKALEIVRSPEGQIRRDQLMANVLSLREQIQSRGMDVYGAPSAIVAVRVGDEALARTTARELPKLGLISNLAEFPAVPRGHARFRLQVMAAHTKDQIEKGAERLEAGMWRARGYLGLDDEPEALDAAPETPDASWREN